MLKLKENHRNNIADGNKVIIKNVTIVQTDNRELKDELLKDHDIRKYMVNDLSGAFEINPDSVSKVKWEIEKKEYYCKLLEDSEKLIIQIWKDVELMIWILIVIIRASEIY